MTGPLETWIIHLSFLCFYPVTQGVYSFLYCQNPYSNMKCHFTKIQSNIAIWQYIAIHSNTIRNPALTHIVSPLPYSMVDTRFSALLQVSLLALTLLGSLAL